MRRPGFEPGTTGLGGRYPNQARLPALRLFPLPTFIILFPLNNYVIFAVNSSGESVEISKVSSGKFYIIYCVDPSKEEINILRNLFDIYEMDIYDSLDINEMPRIIRRKKYVHLIISKVKKVEDYLEKRSFGIFLLRKSILILSKEDLGIRFRRRRDNIDVLLDILRNILEEFRIYIRELTRRYDELENEILKSERKKELAVNLWDLRDDIAVLLKVIKEDEAVFLGLIKGKSFKVPQEKEGLFEDLYFDLQQYRELAESLQSDTRSAFDAYLSLTSYDMGEKIEKLTYITIALSIPEIMASLYGMNVSLPLQTHPLAFFIVLGISILLSFILYLFVRR